MYIPIGMLTPRNTRRISHWVTRSFQQMRLDKGTFGVVAVDAWRTYAHRGGAGGQGVGRPGSHSRLVARSAQGVNRTSNVRARCGVLSVHTGPNPGLHRAELTNTRGTCPGAPCELEGVALRGAPRHTRPRQTLASRVRSERTKVRLLIVEDDSSLTATMDEAPRCVGFEPVLPGSAQGAWDTRWRRRFNLVALDVMLVEDPEAVLAWEPPCGRSTSVSRSSS